MYRPNELKTGLLHLWGWEQNYNPDDFTIADSLTQSETGQFFQEVHPMVTLDNMRRIAPNFELITYPDWLVGTQYRVGDRVTDNELSYRAKIANIGKTPEANPTEWERFDPFSKWLEKKTQASILKAIRTFWDVKMSKKEIRNILESKALFNGTGRLIDLVEIGENLVGFELVPIRANGVTLKIDKIGLQMTGTGPIKMYLMHSSRTTQIKTIELTRTRNGSIEWFTEDNLYLPYVSNDNDAGGSWYLVYDQSALPNGVQAVNKVKDWSTGPCYSCDADELANYNIWSNYLEVFPFKTGAFEMNGSDLKMWDIETNVYTLTSNYGINLQISIECDITDIILEKKRIFQNIIGLQVAVDCLKEFAYNPSFNINRTTENFSRQYILLELDGDSASYKKSGLKYELQKAMEAVEIDVSSLSSVCFPCTNRIKGVKFKVI